MKSKNLFSLVLAMAIFFSFIGITTSVSAEISTVNIAPLGTPYGGGNTITDLDKLNDGVESTFAIVAGEKNADKFLGIRFDEPKKIGKFSARIGDPFGNNNYRVNIQYSTDGIDYATVPGVSFSINPGKNVWYHFTLPTHIEATHLRILTTNNQKQGLKIYEISIYEYIPERELLSNTYSSNVLIEAAGETFTGTLTYKNTFTDEYPLLYCLGLYEETDGVTTLVDVAVSETTILPVGENVEVSATLDLADYSESDLENYTVKAFLWESSENSRPIKPSVIFPDVFTDEVE